jgi:hypothetical protein
MFMLLHIPLSLNMLTHLLLMLLLDSNYPLQILHLSSLLHSYFMPDHLLFNLIYIDNNFHLLSLLLLSLHLRYFLMLLLDLVLLLCIMLFHNPHLYSIYNLHFGSLLIHLMHHLLLLLRYDYSLMFRFLYQNLLLVFIYLSMLHSHYILCYFILHP